MKKVILLCIVLLIGNEIFGVPKILDSRHGQNSMEILCGETDRILVLLDNNPLYLNQIKVSIKGVSVLSTYGYFWRTTGCAIPTNGDLAVSVWKINLLFIIIPYFLISTFFFSLAYFLKNYKWTTRSIEIIFVIFILSMILIPILVENAFSGMEYSLILLPFFFLSWIVVWLVKFMKNNFPPLLSLIYSRLKFSK